MVGLYLMRGNHMKICTKEQFKLLLVTAVIIAAYTIVGIIEHM